MKHQKSYFIFFLFLFPLSFIFGQNFAQNTESAQRARQIFNIIEKVKWEDNSNIKYYTIGVFSSENIFEELKKIAKKKKVSGKPVKIIRYLNYNEIRVNNVVYVSKNENAELQFVYQKLKGKNVLIMSDCSKQANYSIINFKKITADDPRPYDINIKLAEQNHIILSKQLIRAGGNRADIKEKYAEINYSLQKANEEIKKKNIQIDSLNNIINEQKKKIDSLKVILKENNK